MLSQLSLQCDPECLVGNTFRVTLSLPEEYTRQGSHPLDWVGIYPENVPTVPGVSHGQWLYLDGGKTNVNAGYYYAGGVVQESSDVKEKEEARMAPTFNTVHLEFPRKLLPKHSGRFEVRFHRANRYGAPTAVARVRFLDGHPAKWKSAILFGILLFFTASYQFFAQFKGGMQIYVTAGLRRPDRR